MSMTVKGLAEAMGLEVLTAGDLDRPVTGGYCGDLLSWVMGRAQAGDAWITVMGNVNAIAVATLTDVSCIVLTENASLDEDAAKKAEMQGIPVYGCGANSYQTAVQVYELLK